MKLKKASLTLVFCIAGASCSGSSTKPDSVPPDWVRQSTRTVDRGYIVYVGMGEDRAPEKANFKAEAMAAEDLANECSFVPKGARVEDRYDQGVGTLHRSFAKVAVTFQECEDAKNAANPDSIRKLASVQFAEEVKRYQSLVDQVYESDVTGDDATDEDEDNSNANANPALADTTVIHDGPHYFWARQQIVLMKQTVILAAPTAYPPGAPQTLQTTQLIQHQVTAVQTYEHQNPQLARTPMSWSNVRRQAVTRMRQRQGIGPSVRNRVPNNPSRRLPPLSRKRRRRLPGW